jgi:hydrogenase maturation protein HypF
LDDFVLRIESEQPALASVEQITISALQDDIKIPEGFAIQVSREGEVRTDVTADAATCPDCLSDVLDSSNRRYRYPFTNCTHCGPRLSIITAVPYDRSNTSMHSFTMCEQCRQEYTDPANRRFHAQPNACADCGPQLWLEDNKGSPVVTDQQEDAIQASARLLREGKIVAIKGIGGIHLACDATNESAVGTLRRRKARYHKPFALMAQDIDMVERFARANEEEVAMLRQPAAPIVILPAEGEPLAGDIAPGQSSLGFMLPYTPLHHLLMLELDNPIVLTSGNLSDEPQCIDNVDSHSRLDGIADFYLLHDRDIVNRLDDSVVRFIDDKPRFLRRARGYAPQSINLPAGFADGPNILAMGGELKNSFCLLKQGRATVSQHMGDLEDLATYKDYQHNLQLYRQLFDFNPQMIAVDKHPNYLSSQLGRSMESEEGLQLIEVQHHHAHVASCMAEHGLPLDSTKVLGVALDGLGYGDDGSLWGGEFLLVDYACCERLAHFQSAPMLGGTKAMYEPWRNTLAYLMTTLGWDYVCDRYGELEIISYLNRKPIANLQTMLEKGLNSPMATSAGRLFDAVAAAVGVCRDAVSYEGQAAIELEALAWQRFEVQKDAAYSYDLNSGCVNWKPLWNDLLSDLKDDVEPAVIAARFHHTVAAAVADMVLTLGNEHDVQAVVLCGGVFQNRLLLERTSQLLRNRDFIVLSPQLFPANDGGISLGQAAVAMALHKTI